MLRTLQLPLLREDATPGQREAVLSNALSKAISLVRESTKPLVAEDLDFSAKKKALGQLSPNGARIPSCLLYAKYRQQLVAKCAGVKMILINPAYTSTILATGWSVHAAVAGIIGRRSQRLSERFPRNGTEVGVPLRRCH
ncbi:hypothetical protein JJQ59_27760 [Cupriavidus necator]|uniref:Uncharacterized protein n=1 Tax=Cupriavidus necator TaxID=106590 RepID=A0A367PR42_CUPNE|nr:hypothetical protein [Cupriavidus necator]QQX86573.1 hypothetical protein JJQ59_27760 [Cupriavidus necator]RCJ10014.1 hypothetical protein DDK22_02055 [Cupriavidus necator]